MNPSSSRLLSRLTLPSWVRWRPEFAGSDPESASMLLMAVVVGIGAGFGAVVFRWLIVTIRDFSYGEVAGWLSGMGGWHLLVIPALGGGIVGPLVYRYAREAKGHGVPEVMQALEVRGGRIRPRVAIVKAIASSVCIGTGGSVGREGPIAQIG